MTAVCLCSLGCCSACCAVGASEGIVAVPSACVVASACGCGCGGFARMRFTWSRGRPVPFRLPVPDTDDREPEESLIAPLCELTLADPLAAASMEIGAGRGTAQTEAALAMVAVAAAATAGCSVLCSSLARACLAALTAARLSCFVWRLKRWGGDGSELPVGRSDSRWSPLVARQTDKAATASSRMNQLIMSWQHLTIHPPS